MEEVEAKLLEKFREITGKWQFRDGQTMSKSFMVENPMDSDEMISIDLTVRCADLVPKTGKRYVTSYGGVL